VGADRVDAVDTRAASGSGWVGSVRWWVSDASMCLPVGQSAPAADLGGVSLR